jgi:hypothetical protein
MFDGPEFFDTYVDKILIRMKRKSVFYEIPYWEHLKISHLVDLMYILKNVSYSLWRNISLNKRKKLVVMRDLIF